MSKTIELDNEKYTIVYDETNSFPEKCLRYGEKWRNLVGDNLMFWLCQRIEELEEELDDVNDVFEYYDDNFGNMTC